MRVREKLKHKAKDFLRTLGACGSGELSHRKQMEAQTKLNLQERRKARSLVKTVINVVHKFLVLLVRWLSRTVYGEHGKRMPPITNLILMESATSLAAKIRTRKLTSVEVTQAFIDRCKEINPLLNCVVDQRFDEALKDAERADKLVASGTMSVEQLEREKPFLGVPISTKDCIRVQDLLHTSGIWNRRNIRGEKDARAMELMRRAGAIPFALTNVSECCMW